jgi:hypothetical protein
VRVLLLGKLIMASGQAHCKLAEAEIFCPSVRPKPEKCHLNQIIAADGTTSSPDLLEIRLEHTAS